MEDEEMKTGRDAIVDDWKAKNPDAEGEPTDEQLWQHVADRHQIMTDQHNELSGRYDALNGSNAKLAELVKENPQFAQFFQHILAGKSPMYAWGTAFGEMPMGLTEDQMAEHEEGYKQYASDQKTRTDKAAEIETNFKDYFKNLDQYKTDNNLTDDEVQRIDDTIMSMVEAMSVGKIPMELIDAIWKGADDNIDAATQAAELAGRNAAIEEGKTKQINKTELPNMAGGNGGVKRAKPVIEKRIAKRASFPQ
jgi:hypothetical protein